MTLLLMKRDMGLGDSNKVAEALVEAAEAMAEAAEATVETAEATEATEAEALAEAMVVKKER
jgi:hypothetical protein